MKLPRLLAAYRKYGSLAPSASVAEYHFCSTAALVDRTKNGRPIEVEQRQQQPRHRMARRAASRDPRETDRQHGERQQDHQHVQRARGAGCPAGSRRARRRSRPAGPPGRRRGTCSRPPAAPPSSGSTIRAIIGSTRNIRNALRKIVAPKTATSARELAPGGRRRHGDADGARHTHRRFHLCRPATQEPRQRHPAILATTYEDQRPAARRFCNRPTERQRRRRPAYGCITVTGRLVAVRV